jgi:hypothetical protein
MLSISGNEDNCDLGIDYSLGDVCRLTLRMPTHVQFCFHGESCWVAVQLMRESLEPLGYLFCCNAARKNAVMSRMGTQMGGEMIYLVRMGKSALRRDMVDVFDYAPAKDVVTLIRQREFEEKWYQSLR